MGAYDNRPYQTGAAERTERAARRSQWADGSARVDEHAPVVATSQGASQASLPSRPRSAVNADGSRSYIRTSAHPEPKASNPASHHTSGEIPSAGLVPSTYDSTRLALSFDEVMEKIRAPLMDLFMMHLHEHEVAQEAGLATFEKRLLEKVEVDQELFQGEVLAHQKQALSAAQ
ncbi:hypothetical protein CEUSTIGMA_g4463.t1 [Chlamydomonas eustigma]|uniref:Uncharacterized protein n=1 Tax=Chlamydomonas eustigma TaxID=1157962 RepID=A0A250X1T4_9CHLO|nr:hypothetical protein CEUSTIGMA_g4463.t1 [Chlamydomonas eustigma]|eukprot:GAX77016.1 hypothetical protein CEUSTIGMA_g4463.t1 [Chlamydomonas eustigma]